MSNLFYPVLVTALSEEDGGGYSAYVPDLYGCMSDGETPEEALQNAQAAIKEWCDEARRLNRDVPAPYSAREKSRQEQLAVAQLLQSQAETIRSHQEGFVRLSAEVEDIKEQVESLAQTTTESAPWDIVPLYAARSKDTQATH